MKFIIALLGLFMHIGVLFYCQSLGLTGLETAVVFASMIIGCSLNSMAHKLAAEERLGTKET